MKYGPQPLTIEEYRKRVQKQPKEVNEDPGIPKVQKRKRRGGRLQKLKREKAIILRLIKADPPPSWDKATTLWNQIDEINFLMRQFFENRRKN